MNEFNDVNQDGNTDLNGVEFFADDPVFYNSSVDNQPDNRNKVYEVKQNNKKPKSSVSTIVISVILSLIIGTASGYFAASNAIKNNKVDSGDSPTSSSQVNITVDETVNSTVTAVAQKVNPSVVGIRTTAAVQNFFGGSTDKSGEGSGIVYSSDGYIVTNYHVIESAVTTANSVIEVYLAEDVSTSYTATVVGYNISYDLAVIKIDKTGLTQVTIADTSQLKVGDYVAAVGSPGGLQYMGSVTYGIISGLNRTVTSSSSDNAVSLIQTDAAINPGNSGGALVNMNGELVGVNSSKIVSESFEGMGFAIPADTVVDICDKIIAKEYDPDPYIGITFSETWTAARLQFYGYPVGAVVSNVTEGGPAYEAGIRGGDIITEFNGQSITDYEMLNELVAASKPGDMVSAKIYRSGRYYSTAITIGSNNAQ